MLIVKSSVGITFVTFEGEALPEMVAYPTIGVPFAKTTFKAVKLALDLRRCGAKLATRRERCVNLLFANSSERRRAIENAIDMVAVLSADELRDLAERINRAVETKGGYAVETTTAIRKVA